jgi:hypothetical protein
MRERDQDTVSNTPYLSCTSYSGRKTSAEARIAPTILCASEGECSAASAAFALGTHVAPWLGFIISITSHLELVRLFSIHM